MTDSIFGVFEGWDLYANKAHNESINATKMDIPAVKGPFTVEIRNIPDKKSKPVYRIYILPTMQKFGREFSDINLAKGFVATTFQKQVREWTGTKNDSLTS